MATQHDTARALAFDDAGDAADEIADEERVVIGEDTDDAPISPAGRPALQPLTDDDLREDLASLRRRMNYLFHMREVRRFEPLLDAVHEITDPEMLDRRLRRIARDRLAYHAAERQALMRREFADEIADDSHGIAQHVERVGSACAVGELRETVSQITLDAVHAWPEDAPMSLASALRLDPPEETPERYELGALEARARDLRADHDRWVCALVAGMDPDAVLAAELEAAIRHYLAARAWHVWQEAAERATEGAYDAVAHRRARMRVLADGLKVGARGGWPLAALVRLLRASDGDWTPPRCPKLIAKYGAACDERAGDRRGGQEKLVELLRADLKSTQQESGAASRPWRRKRKTRR